jgi:Tfp pilus assembly protein PilX
MRLTTHSPRQRGAALVIGLILLAIITLLAVVGMNISNAELAAATSEQVRLRAFQAAETGLERGLKDMESVTASPGSKSEPDPVGVTGSPLNPDDGTAMDTYKLTIEYRGEGAVSGFSSSGYTGFHYTVASKGSSARNATTNLEEGAYTVNSTGGQQSFTALPTP